MFDVIILIGAAAGLFWFGYFTGASMTLAKAADEQSDDIYEHWRGER